MPSFRREPEFRRDPFSGSCVIVAASRADRPHAFAIEPRSDSPKWHSPEGCPFCSGAESATPPEVLALREDAATANGPGWSIRVVPNSYPALRPDLAVRGASEPPEVPHTLIPEDGVGELGVGMHEVVIEHPAHVVSTTEVAVDHLAALMGVYRDRLAAIASDGRWKYAQVFKNVGRPAGASLAHTHSQIIALPFVPEVPTRELVAAKEYHRRTGRCGYCDLLHRELSDGSRIVAEPGDFVVFCPFASRFPFEMWVIPRRHAGDYGRGPLPDVAQLAQAMQLAVSKIERVLDLPAYNYLLHTSPFDASENDGYHWHWEIIPRIAKWAGFEFGTGCCINPVAPEAAAEILRRA